MKWQRSDKLTWIGPTSRTLRSVYGGKPPLELYRERAIEVRQATGVKGPPFDPFEYAAKLGIQVQEQEGMAIDGRLTCDSHGRFVVDLKAEVFDLRKNFTLAHEIAHTFFYGLLTNPNSFRGSIASDPEEERLCDAAAAELLMPASFFRDDLLAEDEVTPQTLFWLANRYRVSIQAVTIRAAEVHSRLACAFWKREGSAIYLDSISPPWLKRWTLCQTNRSSVELALSTPGKVFTKADFFYGAKDSGRVKRKASSYCFRPNKAISVIEIAQ
ncbi:MAG TPA: ImmA/IrrE family metallo-endopeptidase [Candidatus Binatia bacterium]